MSHVKALHMARQPLRIAASIALSLIAAFSLEASAQVAAPAAPIPISVYAAKPALQQFSLSPDGQRFLAILNKEGGSVLVTAKWDGSDMKGAIHTDNQKFLFNWAHWVNNDRLVASLRFPTAARGTLNFETRALVMDADGSNVVNLVPPSRDRNVGKLTQFQDDVIDWMPDDGQHVLMSILEDYAVYAPGVYNVDVQTGRRLMVLGPRKDVRTWITDSQHRVRVGIRRDSEKNRVEIISRDPDGGPWRTLWEFANFDRNDIRPLGFGKDPQALYVTALKGEWQALYVAHLDQLDAQGKPQLELLAADDHQDIDWVRFFPNGELIGYGDWQEGNTQASFLDPSLKDMARSIDEALPHRYNRIQSFSQDRSRYVVVSSGNGIPGTIYVGDRTTGMLKRIADQYPDLAPEMLVGKKRISFKARDGLEIRGYLTTPKGDAPASGWPLVVLPHGGPISSDDVGFDTWTELLASRGYAVMQINFRGSDNLGRDFRDAGLRRWGLEMQDDLTDGVKWIVDQKLADPKRMCVVGASYGGYAALMGAVKTPDLYRCAVSFAGVSNLVDMSRHWNNFLNANVADEQIGNYWNDRSRLKETSPSERAKEIKIPVLLVHGTADVQVPYEQSETMAKALRSAAKPYQFITQQGGDHNLSRQSDSQQFLEETLRFLDQHIGPSSPAANAK